MRTVKFTSIPNETIPPPEEKPDIGETRPPVCRDPFELIPEFRERIEDVITDLESQGHDARLWETIRTEDRARWLKNKGASKNGHLSMHRYGVAADIICRRHMWRCREHGCGFFEALAATGKKHGLIAGGYWRTFKDWPHLQGVPVRMQSKVRKARGRIAVRAIVAAYLGAMLMMGCDSKPVEQREPRHTTFAQYPVDLVMPPTLSRCEVAAVRGALAWIESMEGRRLARPRTTTANDPAVHGLPTFGQVAITAAPVGTPHTLAEATITATKDGRWTHSADVRISGCDPKPVAHELGHALLGSPHATTGVMSHRKGGPKAWDGPL